MFREKDIIEKISSAKTLEYFSIMHYLSSLYITHTKTYLMVAKKTSTKSKIIKFTKKEKDAYRIRLEILYTVNSKLNANN